MGIHRCSIAAVALVLAVAALAGCGTPLEEPPPPTEEELASMREQLAQHWWDSISTGTTMPDVDIVEKLPDSVAFARQAQCLEDAQLPGVTVLTSGEWNYDGSDPEDPTGERVNVQWWICSQQFPSEGELSWMLSPRQLNWLYDFLSERHIPCLRAVGIEVVGFPSREEFLASFGYPGWLPYPDVMRPTPASSDWVMLAKRCPLPEMMQEFGLPGYSG